MSDNDVVYLVYKKNDAKKSIKYMKIFINLYIYFIYLRFVI